MVEPNRPVQQSKREDDAEKEATRDHTGLIRKYLELADRAFGGRRNGGSDDEPTPSAA